MSMPDGRRSCTNVQALSSGALERPWATVGQMANGLISLGLWSPDAHVIVMSQSARIGPGQIGDSLGGAVRACLSDAGCTEALFLDNHSDAKFRFVENERRHASSWKLRSRSRSHCVSWSWMGLCPQVIAMLCLAWEELIKLGKTFQAANHDTFRKNRSR